MFSDLHFRPFPFLKVNINTWLKNKKVIFALQKVTNEEKKVFFGIRNFENYTETQ